MLESDIRTNPFPGLRSFEQDEEYLFFGREKQIDELLKKLRTTRFLSIIGSSGSGKSSLVKSGLLPSLHSGYMTTAGSNWRVALLRPGNDPIGNLSKVLSESGLLYDHDGDDHMYSSIIEATLRRSRLGLIEAVRQSNIKKGENLLVIVDQFEELFRYSKYEEKLHGEKLGSQAFVNLLLNAINHKEANIYIGLTMRSDFLGECTQFRNLPEAINKGQYLIPRMTRDDIKQAIVGPISVGGGEITPRLLTTLLNDVGDSPDQLPILQHALMRTWDYWEQNHKDGEPIDLMHYEAIGTMSKALSLHAEEALSDLPDEHHMILAESLFKSLTDHGGKGQGIRRPTMLKEICELADAPIDKVKTVIESFRKPGRSLLMPPVGVPLTESTIIDISHESLMRVWTRLKKWDEEESNASETYLRLANDAALYQEGKMGLLRGPELELALKWKDENKPNEKWAQRYDPSFERAIIFLEHSKQKTDFEIAQKEIDQKRRLVKARRTIIIFAAASIFFLFMMLYAFQLKEEANTQRRKAVENEQKATDALSLAKIEEQNARRAEGLAVKAKDEAERAEQFAKLAKEEAEYAANEARIARKLAESSKKDADNQRDIALDNLIRAEDAEASAKTLYAEANILRDKEEKAKLKEIDLRKDAEIQKAKAEGLKNLAESRSESFMAIKEVSEQEYVKGAERAIAAHQLNVDNSGPHYNSNNYNALNIALNGLQPDRLTMNGHEQSVRSIAMNKSNDLIASGDEGGSIYISKFNKGVISYVQKISAPGPIRSLSFSARGDYLISTTFNKHVNIWDANNLTSENIKKIANKKYGHLIKAIASVNFSGEDYIVVSDGIKVLIEKITPKGILAIDTLSIAHVDVIKISKDQSKMLIGSQENLYEYDLGNSVSFGKPKISTLESYIISLAISPNNGFIAAGLLNGKILIKDMSQPNLEGKYFKEHYSRVSSLEFYDFEDRIQLSSTGFDQTIKMMDVRYMLYEEGDNEEDRITINGHDKWIYGGIYSKDGTYFITYSEDQKIKSWYSNSDELAKTVQNILDKRK
jgi:WD40 repeat protein/energy-coupling factor transporter ATP-binding protein EcfA2